MSIDNIGEYVETTGFERTDVPSNSKYSEILINFDPEKGIKIPLMTPDARVYFQLIPKDMIIEVLKTYLPEILADIDIGELITKQKSESEDK